MKIWGVHIASGSGSRWFDSFWVQESSAIKRELQLDATFKLQNITFKANRVALELEDGKAVDSEP